MKRIITILPILITVFLQSAMAQEDPEQASFNFVSKSPKTLYLAAIMDVNSLNKDDQEVIEIPNRQKLVYYVDPGFKERPPAIPSKGNTQQVILDEISQYDFTKLNHILSTSVQKVSSYEKLGHIFGEKVNSEIMLAVNPNAPKPKSIYAVKFSKLLITLNVIPEDDKNIKNNPAIKKYKTEDLMFISRIIYGRLANMFIETDTDINTLKAIINKKELKQKLTDKEEAIMANATIHYQIMDDVNQKLNYGDPFETVYNYMDATITKEDYLRPIYFSGEYIAEEGMVWNLLK